ncbi:DUF423 domain-containing protein [Brevundimonas sp. NIBR11]|uniref:DUF423 domain-containing protein n=1 Tax=Brevundimonas sp. NIBR11 TaxID=3015999 RepID=UPI0022F0DFF6|nr:DUF423 domain-containing protein [Brevundimonas sp. NIBR11]WGM31622.1 hypothetical protein KKHFBJBL_01869 [Brevundimonas sp. NIBR11]
MLWNRNLAVFAAFNGAMAVAVGAFGAHGAGPQIKSLLTTGASYQLAHALFGLICSALPVGGRIAAVAGWLAAAGGLIFCLALALLGLLSLPALGAVAPIGGVLMIAGWVTLAFAALRSQSVNA